MAINIRLTRRGKRSAPFYSIVVADRRTRRDGDCIDRLGTYAPRDKKEQVRLNKERANYWLGQGAQVSETVRSIFRKEGLLKK